MNTDTPDTDAMVSADQHHLEDDNFFSASVYWRMCDLARRIERERDEAREQRDRLAQALQVATAYPLTETWYNQAMEALDTLKPCD
jgi:uncharacterized protein YifN (PemK superfamily)